MSKYPESSTIISAISILSSSLINLFQWKINPTNFFKEFSALPLKAFSSISSFIESIIGRLFCLDLSLIFFTVVSPIPLLGVFMMRSKAKLSFGCKAILKYALTSLISFLS